MIIIGERLNSSRTSVLDAIEKRDGRCLVDLAIAQERAGAGYIDLNAAALMDGEVAALRWAIPLLQAELKVPLSLDTPNPVAMEEGLRLHAGRPFLNSLTAEKGRVEALAPLIRDFRPRVIALCLDEAGPPESAGRALAVARRLVDLLTGLGVGPDDIFIDPLVRPVGVDSKAALLFLESLETVKAGLPGVRTVAGLSNLSFGLPERRLLNRTFLTLSLGRGLDAAICDPLDEDLLDALAAAEALLGRDPSLKNLLRIFRAKKAGRDPGSGQRA